MKTIIIWILVIGLLVLHQDYWNWDNGTLVFGFVPHSLAYHAVVCLVTAAVWVVVVTMLWPTEQVDAKSVDVANAQENAQ